MDDNQVLELAAQEGFAVVERTCAGQWVRGSSSRAQACCLERRLATDWMADRLRRGRIFA